MRCKNCKNELSSESNFCNTCGAKVIRNRLTLKNLFIHFYEEYFDYDNKLLQTLITLFTHPELVISSYINGTRKKYVNVVSYFVIALTVTGFQAFIMNKFFPELMNMDFLAQNGMKDIQQQNFDFVQEYQSVIYMLIVPGYALASKLIFFNYKQYNYTEHLVANMYLAAHVSFFTSLIALIMGVFGMNFGVISFILIPIQILYFAYSFKRLFGLSLKSILLKTLLSLVLLGALFIAFGILMGIIMYYNGTMDQVIEAQRATIEAAKKAQ